MKPIRSLLKSPAFTLVALATLALGIGANTTMFSVINAVLLRPLAYPKAEQLYIVQEVEGQGRTISMAWPNTIDYRESLKSAELAISRRDSYALSGLDGREAEMIRAASVSANFAGLMGLQPALGRFFSPDEDKVGGAPVVVLSDALWNRLFQRDPGVLGRTLTFAGENFTVIGVMPPTLTAPRGTEAWFPIARLSGGADWQDRGNHPGLIGWGRTKPGVSRMQFESELKAISARLEQLYPDKNQKLTTRATPLFENQVGSYRQSLYVLLAATGLVLLIACANLANLLAARGAARAKEIALRGALGASRLRLAGELLAECALLAFGGTALGLLLAWLGRDAIVALSPTDNSRFAQISLDLPVFGFTALLAVGTTLLFGLWPAWRGSRADLQLALKSGAQAGSDAPQARRLRHGLVIGEIALTLLLLAAAMLVLQSLSLVRQLPLGYDPGSLVIGRVTLPPGSYPPDSAQKLVFADNLLAQLQAIPGLERAALSSNPPFRTGWQTSFAVTGEPEPKPGEAPSAEMNIITPDYFKTMRTGLLRGRTFGPQDTAEVPRVCIVDQTLADKHFPGVDPIGRQVTMHTDVGKKEPFTIVGVVPRLKVYGFDEDAVQLPQIYLANSQSKARAFFMVLRTSQTPQAIEPLLRRIVGNVDPTVPLFDFTAMESLLGESWATPRLTTNLLTAFAALALVLAAVGIYGVMAYATERRTREFGVRLALGASPAQMKGLILGTGLRLLTVGLLLGLTGALATAKLLQSVLFGVSAFDPLTYLLATALLGAAALFACWWPARRASKVDPIVALRAE